MIPFHDGREDEMKYEPTKLIETLARMWIECDPNRGGGEPGSGFHPDDPMPEMSGELKDKPRWHWFIPRAKATAKYLTDRGYAIIEENEALTSQPGEPG